MWQITILYKLYIYFSLIYMIPVCRCNFNISRIVDYVLEISADGRRNVLSSTGAGSMVVPGQWYDTPFMKVQKSTCFFINTN